MQSCVHVQSSVIPRLGQEVVLQKSSYKDSFLCAFLYANVYENLCSLLSASERLISLIEAHRRPSIHHPHGIAAETHNNNTYYTNLSETTILDLNP